MKTSLNLFSLRSLLVVALMTALVLPLWAEAFVTTNGLPFSASNLVPGAAVVADFSIENTIGGTYTAGIQVMNTSGDFALFADQMTYAIAGDFAANGDLGDLTSQLELSDIPNGSTHDYTLTLTLKSDAPQNPLMGKSFGFDLCIGFVGEEPECGSVFVPPDNPENPNNPPNPSRSRGGFSNPFAALTPMVLGESVEMCERLLYTYIHPNRQNDSAEVIKLQTFLRDLEGHFDLEVTGVYDQATQQAVDEFQEKYRDKVLRPWGLPLPTRFVYYTTQKMVNEIYCQFTREFPLDADQEAEIAWYRERGIAYRQTSTTSTGESSGTGIVEGIAAAVNGTRGVGYEIASSVGGQAASAAEAVSSGFWSKLIGFFTSLFSR